MTKAKKRLLTLLLAMLLAVGMAVPTFADWTLTPDRLDNNWSNNYLNINRPNSNTEMKGCTLILYHTTYPGFDQNFTVEYSYYNGKACAYFTRTERGIKYAINRANSTYDSGYHKAIMWTLSDGTTDSAFKRPYSDSHGLVNLLNYDESMSYSGDTAGALVYFTPSRIGSGWFASGTPTL